MKRSCYFNMSEVKKIAVIAGDGIGPEVVGEALKVLKKTEELFGYQFETESGLFGGIAIDEKGTPLPQETLEMCKRADAVLLGAVGGPKWDNNSKELRPETGLLGIRKELGLFSNIRPATVFDCLKEASTLKPEVLEGTDRCARIDRRHLLWREIPPRRRERRRGC
jgi:3-isopropylmalate dehydrogenase